MYSCNNVELFCFGRCFVECDEYNGINCPTAMEGTTHEITTISNSSYVTNNNDQLEKDLKIYHTITHGFMITVGIVLTSLVMIICFRNVFGMNKSNIHNNNNNTQNNNNNNDNHNNNDNDDVNNEENKSEKAEKLSSLDFNAMLVTKLARISILKTYLCNIYFYISLFCVFLCAFLGFVCVLYGFGQITELNVTHYWCDRKNLDTIRKHSIEYNLNQGTEIGCWKTRQFNVDINSLFAVHLFMIQILILHH